MDETDFAPKQSLANDNSVAQRNGRPKILRCNTGKKSFIHSRPGQAVQVRTDLNGTRTIDHENEVGECKISTITLSSDSKALDKKIEYLSDNHLDKLTNGVKGQIVSSDVNRAQLETLSDECLPTTTKRSQNDLIQFVFTSHGIRVISDKEYVV